MISNNILFLSTEFPPQPGGIGNHAYNLALALQKEGKQIIVLSDFRSKEGIIEREFDSRLPFQVQRVKRRKIIWLTYLDRFVKGMRLINNVDTVIASGKFSLWMVYFLNLYYKKVYTGVIHGSEVLLANTFLRKFTDNSLKKFDYIIAVSHYTKSLVKELSLKNIVVIPNGFTISENQPVYSLKKKPKNLHLITVGNVTQRKGQHNLVKALPLLLESYSELQYHIVGIPTEKERIDILAKELEVINHIIFHGKVTENRKWELMQSSSIFIMLSEVTDDGDVEGFGIAILEANSVGIPAIGSKGCGIEDAINHGESGLLVDAKDPIAVFQAMKDINESYDEYSEKAIIWSKNFKWDKIVKQYLEIIDK